MTRELDRVTAVSGDANVKAFLQVLREGESNHDDSAYTLINGGGHFTAPPWVHPYAGQSAPPGKAAGAYQFIPHTWERCQVNLGLDDFSPVNQDVGAVYLIDSAGALEAVQQGDLPVACSRLASTWVSLPTMGMTRIAHVFLQYGGTLGAAASASPVPDAAGIPSAPSTTTEKPMGAALMFLPMILQMIPELFKIPGLQNIVNNVPLPTPQGSPHAADYMPLVQSIINAFTKGVPGAINTQDAVEKAQADANVAAAAKQAVLAAPDVVDEFNKLKPVLDSINEYDKDAWAATELSMDSAARRGQSDTFDLAPFLAYTSIGLFGFVTAFVCAIIFVQTWKLVSHSPTTEVWAALTGIIGFMTGSMVGAIISYRFGTSRQSGAKDVLIGQLAQRQQTTST